MFTDEAVQNTTGNRYKLSNKRVPIHLFCTSFSFICVDVEQMVSCDIQLSYTYFHKSARDWKAQK